MLRSAVHFSTAQRANRSMTSSIGRTHHRGKRVTSRALWDASRSGSMRPSSTPKRHRLRFPLRSCQARNTPVHRLRGEHRWHGLEPDRHRDNPVGCADGCQGFSPSGADEQQLRWRNVGPPSELRMDLPDARQLEGIVMPLTQRLA